MQDYWKRIQTTRTAVTDSWTLTSCIRGIQVQKNGRNVIFSKSFEDAWQFIQSQGTSGDHIKIDVEGTLG